MSSAAARRLPPGAGHRPVAGDATVQEV